MFCRNFFNRRFKRPALRIRPGNAIQPVLRANTWWMESTYWLPPGVFAVNGDDLGLEVGMELDRPVRQKAKIILVLYARKNNFNGSEQGGNVPHCHTSTTRHRIMNKKLLLISALLASATAASQAVVIVGADLSDSSYDDAANASGDTAANIPWTSELGQTASSSLVFTGSQTGFIAGGSDAATLGIAGNIETSGAWTTSFTLTPTFDITLSDLTIVSRAISGGGANQNLAQSYRITGTLDGGVYSGTSLGDVVTNEPGGTGSTTSVLDDATGSVLSSGTAYTISFTANYDAPGGTGLDGDKGGNNLGLDSVTLNAVPEPSSAALLGLGGLALILRRRK